MRHNNAILFVRKFITSIVPLVGIALLTTIPARAAQTLNLLQTGQTGCWDASGNPPSSCTNALTWSNSLANGFCGLNDGSQAEDWRLANRKELLSLITQQTLK